MTNSTKQHQLFALHEEIDNLRCRYWAEMEVNAKYEADECMKEIEILSKRIKEINDTN